MKKTARISPFRGLYTEGLRRTFKTALVFAVLGVIAAFIPFSLYSMLFTSAFSGSGVSVISAGEVLGIFLLLTSAAAPVLTLVQFSFLNKRPDSDFFHSLPCTRITLCFSQLLALLTHFAVLIITGAGAFSLALLVNSARFSLIPGSLGAMLAGCFAEMLLSCAAFFVAMTLTGTVFGNFVLGGIITFVPRYLLNAFTRNVSGAVPMTVSDRLFWLSDRHFNISASIIEALIWPEDFLLSISAVIYTFVLALCYFAAALVLFRRRRSETAGSGAPSRRMQALYRILLGFAVSAPVTLDVALWIFEDNFTGFHRQGSIFIEVVLGYLFALIVFFVFELISSKSWKNLLRALPSLGIVAVLNVLLILVFNGYCAAEASWAPDAEKIKEINVVCENDSYQGYGFLSLSDLAVMNCEDVGFGDPALFEAVAAALKKDVSDFRNGEYYSPSYNYYLQNGMETVTLKVRTSSGTKVRRIRQNEALISLLDERMNSSEEFRRALTDVPEIIPGTGTLVYYDDLSGYHDPLGYFMNDEAHKKVEAVWETLREEAKSLSAHDVRLLSGDYDVPDARYFEIEGSVVHGCYPVTVSVIIDKKLTPRTYAAAQEALGDARIYYPG